MGRPRIEDDFTLFFEWMRNTRRCSPGVAKAYTSYMRRVYRELDGNVQDLNAVNHYFAEAFTKDESYAKIRSAWSMYVEYCAIERNLTVPVPAGASVIQGKEKVKEVVQAKLAGLPDDVRSALRILDANGITMNQLYNLRWANVATAEITQHRVTHVNTPGKNTQWIVPSSAMKVLWDYANPGSNLYRPLVPLTPESDEPYPYAGLRREMQIMSPTENIGRPRDGSALGSVLLRSENEERQKTKETTVLRPTTTREVLDLLNAPMRQGGIMTEMEVEDQDDEPELGANFSLASAMAYDPDAED